MSRLKFKFILLLLIAGIGMPVMAQKGKVSSGNGEIISTSDIHFDPFYDPSLVMVLSLSNHTLWDSILNSSADTLISNGGQDANYRLFRSALQQMRKTQPKPKYIIVTGDFLAHNFVENARAYIQDKGIRKEFISNTIKFTAWMFNKYFPNTIVLPILGNNDSYCGDYDLSPNSPFLNMFAKAWVPLQRNNDKLKDSLFVAQFSQGGYYTYSPKSDPGHKLVMMNTIFFSSKYRNSCNDSDTTNGARVEMAWLENELKANAAAPKPDKIWLAYHIPPGIDIFKSTYPGYVTMLWDSAYNTRFLGLLNTYQADVTANFAGHTHMDDFRVVYDAGKKPVSFIHITPSISRSNGNYPGFQVMNYDMRTYKLTNYTTQALNATLRAKPVWGLEYDFNKQYNVNGLDPVTMDAVRAGIHSDTSATRKAYLKYYKVSNPLQGNSTRSHWQCYWCGIGELTPAGYTNCSNEK